MDRFIDAYNMGRQAARLDFEKDAGAKDVAELLKALGAGASAGASGLGKALKGAMGGAEFTGKGLKYLGTTADPRLALAGGLGLAGLGATFGDEIAQMAFKEGLGSKAVGAVPALIGAAGGGLAMAANPGLMGGSVANRMTHELAMAGSTPAGQVATMAALVGLPAALIGYGKKKGKEESSWL
jgi:hypothetical protein